MPSSPKRVRTAVCRSSAAVPARSASSHNHPEVLHEAFHFPFNQLPDEALQQICALASTRSCPAPCQLALTRKGCSEAVTEHVRDAPIELQLGLSRPKTAMTAALATPPKTNILQLTAAPATPPTKQQQEAADLAARIQADCARLFSLSTWLKKNSNLVGDLTITSNSKYANGLDYWQRGLLATGMAAPMQGLAAGRAARGRLRLTAVDLEVLSHSQLQATLDTLSACKQLRRLHLTGPSRLHRSNDATVLKCGKSSDSLFGAQPAASGSGGVTGAVKHAPFHLGLSVSAMSALTHLQLCTDWLRDGYNYESGLSACDGPLDINLMLKKLPAQLQVLHLYGCECVGLSLSSIKHLTQLQSLRLPCRLELAPASEGGAKAPPLPQLTSLTCGLAMQAGGADLLELPGLQQYSNNSCHSNKSCRCIIDGPALGRLGAIKGLRALRLLAVGTVPCPVDNVLGLAVGGPSLRMLPQVQYLTLVLPNSNVLPSTLSHWGYALHGLAGLRSLDVSAKVLLVEFAPKLGVAPYVLRALTNLTQLTVDCRDAQTLPAASTVAVLPWHLQVLRAPLLSALPDRELGVEARLLELVHGAAGRLQQLQLSWVDQPVAAVMAAAAEQLPGVVVRGGAGCRGMRMAGIADQGHSSSAFVGRDPARS